MFRLYSARKKFIYAMSLNIDRPITRAVVVGCAISATRNYLKLHMSRTLKLHSCATFMPKRGSCGSVLPACRLSKQYTCRSNSAARPLLHLTRPPRCPTALSSVLRYHDVTSHSRRAYHQEQGRH